MKPPESTRFSVQLHNPFWPENDLHCSAGLQVSANTQESNEADKNLFRLTPYGALPDWWVYTGLMGLLPGHGLALRVAHIKAVGKLPVHHYTQTSHNILPEFWLIPFDRTESTESGLEASLLMHAFSVLSVQFMLDQGQDFFIATAAPWHCCP